MKMLGGFSLGKGAAEEDAEDEADKKTGDGFPFACHICRKPFTDPVVTKCKHYFCEKCAMEHYKKSSKCAVCGQPTSGIFNTAFDIIKKIESGELKPPPPTTTTTTTTMTTTSSSSATFSEKRKRPDPRMTTPVKGKEDLDSIDISHDVGEDAPVIV